MTADEGIVQAVPDFALWINVHKNINGYIIL
jgi:hypothetical protein